MGSLLTHRFWLLQNLLQIYLLIFCKLSSQKMWRSAIVLLLDSGTSQLRLLKVGGNLP